MKPEESYSARDTLCRLEEELINLDEQALVIIESLSRRFRILLSFYCPADREIRPVS